MKYNTLIISARDLHNGCWSIDTFSDLSSISIEFKHDVYIVVNNLFNLRQIKGFETIKDARTYIKEQLKRI